MIHGVLYGYKITFPIPRRKNFMVRAPWLFACVGREVTRIWHRSGVIDARVFDMFRCRLDLHTPAKIGTRVGFDRRLPC